MTYFNRVCGGLLALLLAGLLFATLAGHVVHLEGRSVARPGQSAAAQAPLRPCAGR